MVRRLGAALLLASSACYSPKLTDCRVRCALDGTCPNGLECDNSNYCRTKDHPPGICQCEPGDTRVCGMNKGVCRSGTQTCMDSKQYGPCEGSIEPSSEICDTKDNDCDGFIDEDPTDAPPCELSLGVCSSTFHACVDGRYSGPCLAEYGSNYERVETKCDLLDNDCDGVIDRRSNVVLAPASNGFELVGLDGGYALATGDPGGASWSVRFFDSRLDPVGGPLVLGPSSGPTSMKGVGSGTVAWFVWQRGGATPPAGLSGASVDLATPSAAAAPLTGLSQPGQLGAVSIGARGDNLLAAWPADGGVGLGEWSSRTGAPQLSLFVPPQPRFASAYEVALSSRASTLVFAGRYFTDDAGTTDLGDGVVSLTDGGSSTKYVATRAAIIDTALGTQAIFDGYCDYSLLGYSCRRSYIAVDYDVHGTPPVMETRVANPGFISGSSASVLGAAWAATWVEGTLLFVGVPAIGARTLDVGPVVLTHPAYGPTRIATSGGDLVAIVYVANGAGQLNGALVCPR